MRAVFAQHACAFLENWPALSADLSPIENVWMHVEYVLWTEYEWSDLATFKAALKRAWSQVTSDKEYLRRVCGSFEKRRTDCIAGGGDKIKY